MHAVLDFVSAIQKCEFEVLLYSKKKSTDTLSVKVFPHAGSSKCGWDRRVDCDTTVSPLKLSVYPRTIHLLIYGPGAVQLCADISRIK